MDISEWNAKSYAESKRKRRFGSNSDTSTKTKYQTKTCPNGSTLRRKIWNHSKDGMVEKMEFSPHKYSSSNMSAKNLPKYVYFAPSEKSYSIRKHGLFKHINAMVENSECDVTWEIPYGRMSGHYGFFIRDWYMGRTKRTILAYTHENNNQQKFSHHQTASPQACYDEKVLECNHFRRWYNKNNPKYCFEMDLNENCLVTGISTNVCSNTKNTFVNYILFYKKDKRKTKEKKIRVQTKENPLEEIRKLRAKIALTWLLSPLPVMKVAPKKIEENPWIFGGIFKGNENGLTPTINMFTDKGIEARYLKFIPSKCREDYGVEIKVFGKSMKKINEQKKKKNKNKSKKNENVNIKEKKLGKPFPNMLRDNKIAKSLICIQETGTSHQKWGAHRCDSLIGCQSAYRKRQQLKYHRSVRKKYRLQAQIIQKTPNDCEFYSQKIQRMEFPDQIIY